MKIFKNDQILKFIPLKCSIWLSWHLLNFSISVFWPYKIPQCHTEYLQIKSAMQCKVHTILSLLEVNICVNEEDMTEF